LLEELGILCTQQPGDVGRVPPLGAGGSWHVIGVEAFGYLTETGARQSSRDYSTQNGVGTTARASESLSASACLR